MFRLRAVAVAVLLASSCQTYDFERVVPFAVSQDTEEIRFASRRLKPNIMLLVDNSLSMLLPTVTTDPACPTGCGNSMTNRCPAACPTRVSEMRAAMDSFLTNRGTLARFGLTVFPQVDADQCRPPAVVNEAIPPATRNDEGTDQDLVANAAKINTTLRTITNNPIGGTPTAAALAFVGAQSALNNPDGFDDQRRDLVILLTDGLPNCNPQNPANVCDCFTSGCSAARTAACGCTLAGSCDPAGNRCNIGCFDGDNSVAQVRALFQRNIQTVVVGFGADVNSGPGPALLKAMADAGGFARRCPNGTTAECGGGACDTNTFLCEQSFYAARNAADLEAALARISGDLVESPCEFTLRDRPDDPKYLAVLVDGKDVQRSDTTWRYDEGANAVIFTGELCTRLERSTPQDPVDLIFRVVKTL